MKKLTVNSSKKEFEQAIKALKLTLPQAQAISMLIREGYHKKKDEVYSLCERCYDRFRLLDEPTFAQHKTEILKELKMLERLDVIFYPYMKWDY